MGNLILDLVYKRNEIWNKQRLSGQDVKYLASLHYYGRIGFRIGYSVGLATIAACFQRVFKPFGFTQIISGTISGIVTSLRPFRIAVSLEKEKERLQDTEDALKDKKIFAIQVIETLLQDMPSQKRPKIIFSEELSSRFDYISYAIVINNKDLIDLSLDSLEAIVAHEVGHFYNHHIPKALGFCLFSDIISLIFSYRKNIPILILINTISILSYNLFKSFQEKQADHFAITHLNKQGAEKTVELLWGSAGIKGDITWKWRGYDSAEIHVLHAATCENGGLSNHPTEQQRITWAMEELSHLKRPSSILEEMFRFFTTPFYGDKELLKRAEDLLSKR